MKNYWLLMDPHLGRLWGQSSGDLQEVGVFPAGDPNAGQVQRLGQHQLAGPAGRGVFGREPCNVAVSWARACAVFSYGPISIGDGSSARSGFG